MTSTPPPNNQLTMHSPPTEARSLPAESLKRTERQQVELSGSASSAAMPSVAVPANAASSPATEHKVEHAGHTSAGVSSRADAERAEILQRIAAFRNLQIKLRQDREKYYDEELARTRLLLSEPVKPRR